jgi:hypothetical protein
MARAWRVSGNTRIGAVVVAGVIAFAYGGGGHPVGVASAQTKPAAAPSTPHAPAKPSAPAPAKPSKPTTATPVSAGAVVAKKAYAEGEKKFKAGDYAAALVDFQVADGVKPTLQAARYIGLCQDNLGHFAEAVAAYERFLAEAPAAKPEQSDEVKRRVAAIKAMPGKVHLESTPAGAAVTVDGMVLAAPTPTDAELAPGSHALHFTADGRVAQDKTIDVAFASKQEVKVELAEQPAPPPPPPPPPPEPVAAPAPPAVAPPPEPKAQSAIPALVTGGLAVVAAGVGTVFGIMALQDKSDFDNNPTSSKADDGENHALVADMAFGVAITLGVTSAVLFFSGGPTSGSAKASATAVAKRTDSQALRVLPIVSPHGAGAGATWRF